MLGLSSFEEPVMETAAIMPYGSKCSTKLVRTTCYMTQLSWVSWEHRTNDFCWGSIPCQGIQCDTFCILVVLQCHGAGRTVGAYGRMAEGVTRYWIFSQPRVKRFHAGCVTNQVCGWFTAALQRYHPEKIYASCLTLENLTIEVLTASLLCTGVAVAKRRASVDHSRHIGLELRRVSTILCNIPNNGFLVYC